MPHCWESRVTTRIIFSLFQGRGRKHDETWIDISYTSKKVWENYDTPVIYTLVNVYVILLVFTRIAGTS